MENNVFEEVLNLLVDVKVEMQRLKHKIYHQLVRKIDICISKVAPLIDVYASTLSRASEKDKSNIGRDKSVSLREFATFQKKFQIKPVNVEIQAQQLLKVKRSFIKEERQDQSSSREIVIDYFMLKYDFKLKQYIILGRQGGQKSDRRVFLDLFTDDRRDCLRKVEKTQSMTNILKIIYTPDKIGEPFILPNCQQQQIKYLFLFSLNECGCGDGDFFQTQTLYCFVAREFILGELTNLMHTIAKICFERRVNQISPNQERLAEVVENFNTKKTYLAIEDGIQNFLRNFDEYKNGPNLTVSKMQRWKSNTHERYLQRSSLRWSLFKQSKPKQQRCCLTLVLLFYFAITQYKIVIISQQNNKHIVSELIIGLLNALQPLTFIYPIVTATITPHHMEFTNSPVPLFLGLWGVHDYHAIAKSSIKKLLKQQRELTKEELQRETLMVIFDIEDHTMAFSDYNSKDIFAVIQKMQNLIEIRYEGTISQKLAYFMTDLIIQRPDKLPDWALQLRKKLFNTQMYQYFTNRNEH